MKILLANPRGFCAGVDRAIDIVEQALARFGPPIYVRHEVVHNRFVVEGLRRRGAVFVDELAEIPDGSTVIFSAHGVAKKIREEAAKRQLRVLDATCPLVTKVHREVVRNLAASRTVILIGHAGHPEVEGTLGQWIDKDATSRIYLVETESDVAKLEIKNSSKIAYVTQTTLSMDDTSKIITALRQRFPALVGPKKDDICYATQNRQNAVKELTNHCDLVLVVGSPNSSNSNRLREIAHKRGIATFLIDGPEDIQKSWLKGKTCLGLAAGASAPEILVQQVIDHLRGWGITSVKELEGNLEYVVFPLPKELMGNSVS